MILLDFGGIRKSFHPMTSDKHYAPCLPKAGVVTVVPLRPARD